MKKNKKVISLALALVMMISLCACDTKPSRSGIRHNDAQSKPEGTVSTMTDPVATTVPDPTDPTDTQPTDPSGTSAVEPVEFTVSDIMYISELCIGLGPDQAEELLTAVLSITEYTAVDGGSTSGGAPGERFLRDIDRDIIIGGVPFKSIGIHCNPSGVVVDVDYTIREKGIFDGNEAFDSESAYNSLYPLFCGAYGDPSDDYSSTWVDFDKSGLYGWKYDQYWISLFWGMSCQSVKGNDQLVIGIEHEDPSNLLNGGGSTTRSVSSSYRDIYQLMENVIGMDLDAARNTVNTAFGIDIGKPSDTTGDGSGNETYTYDVDITVDDFHFNQIELDVNKDKTVYHIGFINNTDPGDKLHEDCMKIKDITAEHLDDDPTLEFPLDDDNQIIEFYDFVSGKGYVISAGAYYSDFYNSFWFTCENSSLGI